jgi:ssRNA-specific RNase YbeY (16S rRNA maturation enzyme)
MAAAGHNPALKVDIVDERGRRRQVRGLAAWLRRIAPSRARGAVTIVLVSDPRMRALNRTYRGKDYATDVLSFPAFAPSEPAGASAGQAPQLAPSPEPRVRRPRLAPSPQPRVRSSRLAPSPQPRVRSSRLAPSRQPLAPTGFLGDIVIARGVAKRQARAAGHPALDELRLLALHGLLHLLGYDHERDNGRMRRVERRLRLTGGLRQGLIERASE